MKSVYGKNPNPMKDQHFMIDKEMLELIYDTAKIQPGESIIEIGGGEGALTDYLIKGENMVTVIENDQYYANFLKQKYANCPNLSIIEGNALLYNFCDYDRIVANLPYTITESFLINLAVSGALEYNSNFSKGSNLKKITLVLSQNSVRKMVAPIQIIEGKNKYENQEFGLMGAICKAFCDVEIVSAIPSKSFFPEPAVTSFVVNLTPKKEKTTVDRIVREFLIDRKGNHSSIKRIYQTLLAQEKVYKLSKYKNNMYNTFCTNITSSSIENKNIYDLSNGQISQLFQDLIRNDISIKSKNNSKTRNRYNEFDESMYLENGKFIYVKDDFYNEEDDENDKTMISSKMDKLFKKYDYMYDIKQYLVLLDRGLEYLDSNELQIMLGNQSGRQKSL